MRFLSWKIRTKLFAAFSVLFMTMLVTATLNWVQVGTADDATNDALRRARILRGVDALMSATIDQETGLRGYLLSGNEAFLVPYKLGQQRLNDATAQLRTDWEGTADQLNRLAAFLDENAKWRVDVAEPELELMKSTATQSKAHDIETSGAGKSSMDQMRAKTAEMAQVAQDRMDKALSIQDAAISTSYYTLAVATALSLVSALGAAIVLVLTIARPIRAMTDRMLRLAAGDKASQFSAGSRGDEIGAMAGAVEVFRQAAIQNQHLEQEAEASRQKSEADRVRLTEEAEAAAQGRLRHATSGLAVGLRRLAGGDLSFKLDDAFSSDFEALRHDLNGAVEQLADTLRSVAAATGAIDTGSREISAGANDLSKRTEQQAAALEETAAALDQITVNVSNSSKRADEARTIAVQASLSAERSGTVVASAVNAMQKIEQSSNEVSNIIGVIDEIAFQTNLLALNAGVEAARAGEAGKGFAVVAQEVRELAQRSAKAAKEIKELIRNSSTEVQNGVKLVSETGQSLKTIESFIVSINQHMDSIATSAKEQSVGLSEVNTAVNQMDQVTQQNAAMVEETSAASASLAGESSRLKDLIIRFKLVGLEEQMPSSANLSPRTVGSSPRKMTAQIARAFGNAAVKDSWEEF